MVCESLKFVDVNEEGARMAVALGYGRIPNKGVLIHGGRP